MDGGTTSWHHCYDMASNNFWFRSYFSKPRISEHGILEAISPKILAEAIRLPRSGRFVAILVRAWDFANQEIFTWFSLDTHTPPWLGARRLVASKISQTFELRRFFSTTGRTETWGCGVCFLRPVKWWRPWLRPGTLQNQWCHGWGGNPGKHEGTQGFL